MGRAGHQPWREGEVGEREERPERGEDEEVVLRRGVQERVVMIPVRDCRGRKELSVTGATLVSSTLCGLLTIGCQPEYYQGEECLDSP